MSDHVDGPRVTADPPSDLTDLYAFTSPTDRGRTVLIADVFPFAGETALFSNAVNYSIVVRPVRVAGIGNAASFKPDETEIRFLFQLEVLKSDPNGVRKPQTGICKLPDGRNVTVVVGDEQGASTPDGAVRVFAGIRSDPFFIGWLIVGDLKSVPNLVQGDNVLCMVIEFDTARFLNVSQGTLFGVIAETTSRAPLPDGVAASRFDWFGRPELANFGLNTVPGLPDLRDLWNQETPYAISETTLPLYRERLIRSYQLWDSRGEGKADWPPAALAAHVNVSLDDFLLFNVAKPITDTSYLEIEKSTINGHAYKTGGGRTLNANAVDILTTWLVNYDRGPFMKSATEATQPGGTSFPYVQPPNTSLITVTRSVELAASPREVWAVIGKFGEPWLVLASTIKTTGTGIGQLRFVDTIDGRVIVERLTGLNETQMKLNYALVSGIPAAPYEGSLEARPKGTGSNVTWTIQYRPEGVAGFIVHTMVTNLQRVNLDNLKTRFGSAQ